MNVNANLFYNYKTIGDVLMAVIDNESVANRYEKHGDVTLIFCDDKLIGINFFNISEVFKIKSAGKIDLPPRPLIDGLNSLLLPISDYQLDYVNESKFVIGRILEVKEHPQSDHLHILKVDVGTEVLQIVCGAINVEENKLCVVATIGAMMNDGTNIKPGVLLGVESNGMCCSPKELGIEGDYPPHHLLFLEESEAKVGQDFYSFK